MTSPRTGQLHEACVVAGGWLDVPHQHLQPEALGRGLAGDGGHGGIVALAHLPAESRILVTHLGGALSGAMAREARAFGLAGSAPPAAAPTGSFSATSSSTASSVPFSLGRFARGATIDEAGSGPTPRLH